MPRPIRRGNIRRGNIPILTKEQKDSADSFIKANEERLKLEEQELRKAEEEFSKSQDNGQKERDRVLHEEVNKLREASIKHREETIKSPEFRKEIQRLHAIRHRGIYGTSKERLSEHLEQFIKQITEQYIKNDQNSITQNSRVKLLRMGLSIDDILRLGSDPRILSQTVKQREEEEKQYKSSVLQPNRELLNDIKMKGQKRWRVIASENDHFPYDPIPIGAELRYGAAEKWFYKTMTEDMKEKRSMTSHDALGLDHDVAPGIVKQLEIHETYNGSKWVPITKSGGGKKTRRNRNLKKRRTTRKH
jgi:hypothetical protein